MSMGSRYRRSAVQARKRWRRYGIGGPWTWALLGLLAAMCAIGNLDGKLQPIVSELAAAEAQNVVTATITDTVHDLLQQEGWDYQDIVTVERDDNGQITALHSNTRQSNLMRTQVVDAVLQDVSALELREFDIALGSLLDSDLFSGRGPFLRVRTLSVGTVRAEIQSTFSAVGINQTQHKIMLQISVPISIMIASRTVKTEVTTSVCVAETIIVGAVPETYLQLPHADTNE